MFIQWLVMMSLIVFLLGILICVIFRMTQLEDRIGQLSWQHVAKENQVRYLEIRLHEERRAQRNLLRAFNKLERRRDELEYLSRERGLRLHRLFTHTSVGIN